MRASFPTAAGVLLTLASLASPARGQAPVAEFVGTPTWGLRPLTVDFQDLSTGNPTRSIWDFGDGTTLVVLGPPTSISHIYRQPGVYTVELLARNAFGQDRETKVAYVNVLGLGKESTRKLNGLIAFTSYRRSPGHFIYTMNPDGTRERPFLATYGCYEPAWSPDGRFLLYVGYGAPYDTWILRADGTVLGRIGVDCTRPVWGRLPGDEVFVANEPQVAAGDTSIYALLGGVAHRLTSSGPGVHDTHPAWSRVAYKVAFASDRDGNSEIYLMNPDGTGQVNITNDPANDGDAPATDGSAGPDWSPDGARIAFETDRDGNFEIYLMNADGTGLTRLTNDPAKDTSPAWSPDGTMIAFTSYRTGGGDVYVMNADGTNQTRLTDDPSFDGQPDWQPRF